MTIPALLAFPPTSLRNVAAGLVVGNPIGSSGTRGKALTSAELKAIVEASGVSYVPYTGATGAVNLGANGLTCGDITSSAIVTFVSGPTCFVESPPSKNLNIRAKSGILTLSDGNQNAVLSSTTLSLGTSSGRSLETVRSITGVVSGGMTVSTLLDLSKANCLSQRNGLNAQTYELFETYTSDTNYGSLCLKATSSGHQIGSARGTSGSNRALQLGHFDSAGAFTAGLSVATSGAVAFVTLADGAAPNSSLYYSSTQSKLVYKDAAGVVNNLY